MEQSMIRNDWKAEFIRQVKNPYYYRVGNIIVKLSYSGDTTLTKCFQKLVLAV